jgi:hypothetical protein
MVSLSLPKSILFGKVESKTSPILRERYYPIYQKRKEKGEVLLG